MGLYKLCEHKGRARDRCEHVWWARFRHVRVSLEKWSNDEIKTKTKAEEVFDDLKKAVRAGRFDKRGVEPKQEATPLTLRQFADVYKERHVFAKGLAIGDTIDYRLRPIVNRFSDRLLTDIKTARRRGLHRGSQKASHRGPTQSTAHTVASVDQPDD